MNKWLALQAMSDMPGNVENVKKLLNHTAFDLCNPNKVCFFEFDVFRTLQKSQWMCRILQKGRTFGGSDLGTETLATYSFLVYVNYKT